MASLRSRRFRSAEESIRPTCSGSIRAKIVIFFVFVLAILLNCFLCLSITTKAEKNELSIFLDNIYKVSGRAVSSIIHREYSGNLDVKKTGKSQAAVLEKQNALISQAIEKAIQRKNKDDREETSMLKDTSKVYCKYLQNPTILNEAFSLLDDFAKSSND